jgi:hypothetical protein
MSKKVLQIFEALYRILLRLYPAEYRQIYGEVMAQTFRDMVRAAYARSGFGVLLSLWIETLGDIVKSVVIEHLDKLRMGRIMSKKGWVTLGLAIIFSIITGYINITATEVQAPMGCILLFAFLAGLIQPKAPWRWALLIGLSIPLSTFIGLAINFHFPDPPPHFPITLVVLVIPALIAAYGGSLVSRLIQPTPSQAI